MVPLLALRGGAPPDRGAEMSDSPPGEPPAAQHGAHAEHVDWGKAEFLSGSVAVVAALGIFLSLLMGALDQFVVITALKQIVGDLGQPGGFTFVVSAYLVTSTVAVAIFARLSDIVSRRNIFLLGMGIFIVGSIFAGVSQNLTELIIFRGVQGFGSGCFFPVGVSIIAVAFSPEMRARLTGAFSGVFGIATVAGPFLGSYIVDHSNWRWVFYINIPVGVLGMAVLASALGPFRPAVRGRFDLLGAALLSLWVSALMVPLYLVTPSEPGATPLWQWTDPQTIALLVLSVLGAAVFAVYEWRVAEPLVHLRLFRDRVVASCSAVATLTRGAVFPLLTLLTGYVALVILRGDPNSADTIRNMLYFLVIPMVLGSIVGGQGLTRVTYRTLVGGGSLLMLLGLLVLTQITVATPIWAFRYDILPSGGLILGLIPLGLGLGLTFAPVTVAVQYRVPPNQVGQATGLIQFLGTLSAAVGLALFGAYQTWRQSMLDPNPPAFSCYTSFAAPSCGPQVATFLSATVTSYVEVIDLMIVLVVMGTIGAFFLTGRLPRSRAPPGSVPPESSA